MRHGAAPTAEVLSTPPRRGAARGGTRSVPLVLAACVHDSAMALLKTEAIEHIKRRKYYV